MSKNLVPYEGGILAPKGFRISGLVFCPAGTNETSYEGAAGLFITENAVVVSNHQGIVQEVSLGIIEDVETIELPGVFIPIMTSDGQVRKTPPPGDYGVKVTYKTNLNIKGSLKLLVMFPDAAYRWEGEIRQAVIDYRSGLLGGAQPKK